LSRAIIEALVLIIKLFYRSLTAGRWDWHSDGISNINYINHLFQFKDTPSAIEEERQKSLQKYQP
jgi:hypothetical protein